MVAGAGKGHSLSCAAAGIVLGQIASGIGFRLEGLDDGGTERMIGPRRVRLKLLEKRLTHGLGMRRGEQELYGLLDNPRGSSNFVSYRDYKTRIRPVLNAADSGVLADNKWVFYQLAKAFGIAIPNTWALFDSEFGITIEGLPCRRTADLLALIDRVRPKGLVIKPAGGLQGKGLVILDNIDHTRGTAVSASGETVDLNGGSSLSPRSA